MLAGGQEPNKQEDNQGKPKLDEDANDLHTLSGDQAPSNQEGSQGTLTWAKIKQKFEMLPE